MKNKYKIHEINSVFEFESLLNNDDEFKILKLNRINQKFYFDVLFRVKYVLCLPGILIPVTHTLFECISVGAIPITNISDFLGPKGKLFFKDYYFESTDELSSLIELIRNCSYNLNPNEIGDFYDKDLSSKKLFNLLNLDITKISTVDETIKYYNSLINNN